MMSVVCEADHCGRCRIEWRRLERHRLAVSHSQSPNDSAHQICMEHKSVYPKNTNTELKR